MPKAKKKFIDKKSSSTFRLVHRSQRDPLIAAGEESSHVLAPLEESRGGGASKNAEEEQKFGIYYEDDYNYLQHLRDVNEVVAWEPVEERFRVFPDGQTVEAGVDLPAVVPKGTKRLLLPSSIFETKGVELETGLLNQAAPSNALRLDWDLEVINALEDDFDFDDPNNLMEDDFVLKANQSSTSDPDADDEELMDGEDSDEWEDESTDSDGTIGKEKEMPLKTRVVGRADFADFPNDHERFGEEETKSRFTEYSMTSSVLRRNQGLKQLDDEFEKLYEKYDEEEMGDLDGMEDEITGFIRPDSERMQKLIEEFQVNKDDKIVLPGQMSVRQYIGEDSDDGDSTKSGESTDEEEEPMERILVEEGPEAKWDCESVLTTNSTLYNHPSLIKEPRAPKKIKVNPATGLPEGVLKNAGVTSKGLRTLDADGKSERSVASNRSKASSFRPKDETAEDRKARKAEIKAIRRDRRLEKKANSLVFREEEQKEIQMKLNQAVNQFGLRLV